MTLQIQQFTQAVVEDGEDPEGGEASHGTVQETATMRPDDVADGLNAEHPCELSLRRGWLTPAPGYWTDEQGGRDAYSAIKYYRLGDKLEEAYNELNQMTLAYEAMSQKIDDLIKAQTQACGGKRSFEGQDAGSGDLRRYGFGYEGHNDFVVGIGLDGKVW